MITKGERTELRSIVRQQFKVLRSETEQRKAELIAEMEGRISDHYSDVDQKQQDLMWKCNEITEAASRQITDLLRGEEVNRGGLGRRFEEISVNRPIRVQMEPIGWNKEERVQRRRALIAAIEADIKGALMRLERQEADLLRTLAIGAIESEEAQAFLTAIPSVAELVPASRLAELEAQFEEGALDAD